MKKILLIVVIFIVGLLLGLYLGNQRLASLLLSLELTSNQRVNEIIAQENKPLSPIFPQAIFNNQIVDYQNEKNDLMAYITQAGLEQYVNVLGAESDKWIEIVLSQQKLNTWEGNSLIGSYLVSTGLWASTPTGEFKIWTKIPSATMSGGSKALGTYYYLPNVPCTMYFHKGYGIHGTYWHNNFGHPMSHGCVNMRTPDACQVFAWANVGTKVVVHN